MVVVKVGVVRGSFVGSGRCVKVDGYVEFWVEIYTHK